MNGRVQEGTEQYRGYEKVWKGTGRHGKVREGKGRKGKVREGTGRYGKVRKGRGKVEEGTKR